MASSLSYSSLGSKIRMEANLSDLSSRDKIQLLHQLLLEFAPAGGDSSPEATTYRDAADAVLSEANKQWR